ncbi:MAG: hypothetical protein ABS77_10490 [Phenylobacterium sp. SCN 69-14]|nr:MAG: hypothetical protein ABS77_10490 [Phenylobacterium sp. SCN 69-14]
MAAIKLTTSFCEGAKAEAGRQVAFPDRDVRGLELRVSGEGRKSWSFRYRTRLGRQGRVTLGAYSRDFGLSAARAEARRTQVIVDAGGDPAEQRRTARVVAQTEHVRTFGDLAEAYFGATEKGRYRPKRATSLRNERAVYRVHIERALGRLTLETVSRRTVKAALERMLDTGVTSQAVKAQAVIRQMLSYAVDIERLPYNPIGVMAPVIAENARSRVYSDQELRDIWTGVGAPEQLAIPDEIAAGRRDGNRVAVGPAMRLALRLSFLLLQRRCEVLGMALDELDLERGLWSIPAARMKSKRAHVVPLPPHAVATIREAIELNDGLQTSLVFPSRVDARRPMHGSSMNHALAQVLAARGIQDGTIHDIRRTGSTLMTSERLGISPFIRSKILGHNDAGGGAKVSATHYDANSYLPEKRRALERWNELLAEIVSKGEGSAT